MGLCPRIVTEDVTLTWDGVTQRLPKGQVMDVPPGSALERAIGLSNLVPLGGASSPPPPVPEPAAARPAAVSAGEAAEAAAGAVAEAAAEAVPGAVAGAVAHAGTPKVTPTGPAKPDSGKNSKDGAP